jgi:hypothetical protein
MQPLSDTMSGLSIHDRKPWFKDLIQLHFTEKTYLK